MGFDVNINGNLKHNKEGTHYTPPTVQKDEMYTAIAPYSGSNLWVVVLV